MSSTEQQQQTNSNKDESLKLAVAVSLLRSKLLQKQPPLPPPPPADADALKWKRKAKERKEEIERLRENLKEAEDSRHSEIFSQAASCKCYFFDDLGRSSDPNGVVSADGSGHRFNDVLRRRFLRQVRFVEKRRRPTGSSQQRRGLAANISCEDERETLGASVDFLVELCDTISSVNRGNFRNWSHQAVDFILASLKSLSSKGRAEKDIEEIISSLIRRLIKRMCSALKDTVSYQNEYDDPQFFIQSLIRKLGVDPYIGQRAILSVSQTISVAAENLLFLDPFDDTFPNLHQCMYILIQLVEYLLSDYLSTWSRHESFDDLLFAEWVRSILQARKASECLESRNGLYVLYMDRVLGELAKQVGQSSSLQKLSPEILNDLF